jgi:hypothetical protein
LPCFADVNIGETPHNHFFGDFSFLMERDKLVTHTESWTLELVIYLVERIVVDGTKFYMRNATLEKGSGIS